MDIKKVSQYVAGSVQNPKGPAPKVGGEDKTPASNAPADRVNLSNHYQVITKAKRVIASGGDVRTEMVVHVRTQLDNRTYVVDADAVAGKMLDEVM